MTRIPRPVCGEDHVVRRGRLGSARPSTWGSDSSTPWNRQTCSATRVVVTGSATRPVFRSAATRLSTTSSARSSLTISPFSIDDPDPLAHRVEPHPERGPGGRHHLRQALQARPQLGDRLGRGQLIQPAVEGEHVDADPAEQARHDQGRGAARAVGDDLHAALADRVHVHAAQQFAGVPLHDTGRVGELRDLPGEGAPVLLPGENALQLALGRLGQLGAAFVQEDDVDGLDVPGRGAARSRRCSRRARSRTARRAAAAPRRSTTLMALAFSAPWIARFSVRAARDTSRDVVTVEPFFSVVAYALASRTHSSGVTSVSLIRPDAARPNRVRLPRDSQITLLLTTAPALIVLNGYTLTPANSRPPAR